MKNPPALEHLVEALRCLPGVGPKSALRMTYHLLQRDRAGAANLAQALQDALEQVGHCSLCNNFSEAPVGVKAPVIRTLRATGRSVGLTIFKNNSS